MSTCDPEPDGARQELHGTTNQPVRVLVVDDRELSRKLLCYLLNGRGFTVAAVADAEATELFIRTARPDVLLVDIELPGIHGLELTRRLRADTTTSALIILLVTARAMAGDREKGFEAGCDAYLAKPIDTRALPEVIRTLVARLCARPRSPIAVTGRCDDP